MHHTEYTKKRKAIIKTAKEKDGTAEEFFLSPFQKILSAFRFCRITYGKRLCVSKNFVFLFSRFENGFFDIVTACKKHGL